MIETDPGTDEDAVGQATHALAPVAAEYVPARQFTHAVEELAPDTLEYVPAPQLTHAAAALAPDTTEYVPALQFAHALAPGIDEKDPAGHKTHVLTLLAPAVTEYDPVPQLTHAAEEFAPGTTEYDPAGHDTHALEPVTFLYCPAAHGEHTPPFGPVYPALQVQLLRNPLELGAREFPGHRLQLGLPSGDHCPNGQLRHVSFPTAL